MWLGFSYIINKTAQNIHLLSQILYTVLFFVFYLKGETFSQILYPIITLGAQNPFAHFEPCITVMVYPEAPGQSPLLLIGCL